MNFTQNSIEAHHRHSLFGYKARPEVVPWPEEHTVTPLRQMETVYTNATKEAVSGAQCITV